MATTVKGEHGNGIVGIRREDKNRWERRVPLTPSNVRELVAKHNLRIIVQPSDTRIFTDEEYSRAGAEISEDLDECGTIVAVKEVPEDLLIPERTYMFFSHTIKAQESNLSLLDTILVKKLRMLDYECITDENGNRLVKFGPFAGYAGTIDMLSGLGDRLLALGYSTPFVHVALTKNYPSLERAQLAVSEAGEEIAENGLPKSLVPLTIVVTGNGSVSKGALNILQRLPHRMITVAEMKDLSKDPSKASNHEVYICQCTAEDMVAHKEGKPFDKDHYYENPSEYSGIFHKTVMPYAKVIVNGMYWDQRFPRLCSISQFRRLNSVRPVPLLSLADITCDPKGSLEFFVESTELDEPFYIWNPESGDVVYGDIYARGVQILGVDHLPAETAAEASKYFGDALLKYLPHIAKCPASAEFSLAAQEERLPGEVFRAVMAWNGKLTPNFEYIEDLKRERILERARKAAEEEKTRSGPRVLLLGAGFVAGAALNYLLEHGTAMKLEMPRTMSRSESVTSLDSMGSFSKSVAGYVIDSVTLGTLFMKDGNELVEQAVKPELRNKVQVVQLDVVKDEKMLDALVQTHDLVISLVPATMHYPIVKLAVQYCKHAVLASYFSDELHALHEQAAAGGCAILGEMGLDPGIDHMSAMKVINDVREANGKIRTYRSYCGGLMAPECANNPLAYKFSWSPMGVLRAAQNTATWLENGEVRRTDGSELYSTAESMEVYPGFALESVPNRDSTKYSSIYGIKDEVHTMVRGTLRYPGFSQFVTVAQSLGMLDASESPLIAANPRVSWFEVTRALVGQKLNTGAEEYGSWTVADVKAKLLQIATEVLRGDHKRRAQRTVDGFEWMLLLDSKRAAVKEGSAESETSVVGCLCELLKERLAMKPKDRDCIIMQHTLGIEWPNGEMETQKHTMVCYGDDDGFSAMAKTVGYTVAAGALLILNGSIDRVGVYGPMTDDVYVPVLRELEKVDIKLTHDEW